MQRYNDARDISHTVTIIKSDIIYDPSPKDEKKILGNIMLHLTHKIMVTGAKPKKKSNINNVLSLIRIKRRIYVIKLPNTKNFFCCI